MLSNEGRNHDGKQRRERDQHLLLQREACDLFGI